MTVNASHVSLSEPILYTDNDQPYAILNLSWENAWNNSNNHDAVWLFFKFLKGDNGYQHVQVLENGHRTSLVHQDKKVALAFEVPDDRLGVFIYPKTAYRGHLNMTIKIFLDKESYKKVNTRSAHFSAYAIEMVQIPSGDFVVGAADTTAVKFGALYQSDEQGNYNGTFKIEKENQTITVGPKKNQLYYKRPEGYEGDQKGIIPEKFPKGVQEFYMMKYEPTQGQYADFLNSLSDGQSQSRTNFGGKSYYKERGSIRLKDGKYQAEFPHVPCNFMSWDDAMAYADWAGLRPMTEFEFTKAARGTQGAIAIGFPWGTDSKDQMQRMVNNNGELKMRNGWTEAQLSPETKAMFGASYYWVMDLAGSLWERLVTIGDEKGRAFEGTHGDGKLSDYGFATNKDWPKGIEETGGFGFRGGGFYGYGRDYHNFNPYSPIAFRPYGAWSGGNRTKAYGARFVKVLK